MRDTAARAMLRPSRIALRRTPARSASSTTEAVKEKASEAASKAKETASQATSKASEGLSKVQSSASSSLSKAGSAASDAAGRTGGFISRIQSVIPPTVYYSKVALEMAKIVFKGQKMSPPTGAQFQQYFQPLFNAIRHPSTLTSANPGALNPQQLFNRVQNINTAQMVTAGVVAAEVLGFFTVGEMIGKLKIVGYRGETQAHH